MSLFRKQSSRRLPPVIRQADEVRDPVDLNNPTAYGVPENEARFLRNVFPVTGPFDSKWQALVNALMNAGGDEAIGELVLAIYDKYMYDPVNQFAGVLVKGALARTSLRWKISAVGARNTAIPELEFDAAIPALRYRVALAADVMKTLGIPALNSRIAYFDTRYISELREVRVMKTLKAQGSGGVTDYQARTVSSKTPHSLVLSYAIATVSFAHMHIRHIEQLVLGTLLMYTDPAGVLATQQIASVRKEALSMLMALSNTTDAVHGAVIKKLSELNSATNNGRISIPVVSPRDPSGGAVQITLVDFRELFNQIRSTHEQFLVEYFQVMSVVKPFIFSLDPKNIREIMSVTTINNQATTTTTTDTQSVSSKMRAAAEPFHSIPAIDLLEICERFDAAHPGFMAEQESAFDADKIQAVCAVHYDEYADHHCADCGAPFCSVQCAHDAARTAHTPAHCQMNIELQRYAIFMN